MPPALRLGIIVLTPKQEKDIAWRTGQMKKAILITTLCSIVPTCFAVVPSFQALGDLSGGDYKSVALGISADGSTVVGYSNSE